MTRSEVIASLKHFRPEKDKAIDWDVVNLEALQALDKSREEAGIAIVITSNYRTPEHDMRLAGFVGAHAEPDCTAFDIACGRSDGKFDGHKAFILIPIFIRNGFHRVLINNKNNHIHIDRSKIRTPNYLGVE